MKIGLRSSIATIGALALFLSLGCRVDKISPPQPSTGAHLTSLAINPSEASMAPGSTLQLEAIGVFGSSADSITDQVTWKSLNPETATVNSSGLVSSLATGSGTAIVTASSGSVNAAAVITISALASLSVTPSDHTIAAGTALQFTAVGNLQNGSTQDVTNDVSWSATDAGLDISPTGMATTATGTTGTSTISATFSSVTGTAFVTVAKLLSLAVTPFESSIADGTTRQFTATGTLSNGATQNMTSFATWSSTPSSVAIVNNRGLVASFAPGPATITASFENVSGSALLSVQQPTLLSLSITPVPPSLAPGSSQQFMALAAFSDGTSQDVTNDAAWLSSNAQVAFISNTPGTKGLATAVAPGTTVITASLFNKTSNQIALTVATASNTGTSSISITPANPSVSIGTAIQLNARSVTASGAAQEVTGIATWQSSNTAVAIVSQGFVTTLSAGSTIITVSSGGISSSTVLIVTPF